MRILLLLLALTLGAVSPGFTQEESEKPEVAYGPLGLPCEPGTYPLGTGFPYLCPALEEQGILVFLKTKNPDVKGFKTTVKYTTADGEEKEAVQTVARSENAEWTGDVFKIGRIKFGDLAGNTVNSVETEPLLSLE